MNKKLKILLIALAAVIVLVIGAVIIAAVARSGQDVPAESETPAPETAEPSAGNTVMPASTPTPEHVNTISSTLAVGGDIVMHTGLNAEAQTADGYDYTPIFGILGQYISGADYAVCSLVTTLSGSGPYTAYPLFKSPASLASSIASVGFDLVNTGTSHAVDSYKDGIDATLGALESAGLSHVGTYSSEEARAAGNYTVADVGGVSVAFLSYTCDTNDIPVAGFEYAVSICTTDYLGDGLDVDYELMQSDLAAAREAADIVFVFMSWGDEFATQPNTQQQEIADFLFENGADIIIGGKCRVPQPMELREVIDSSGERRTGFICYSLGNFLSCQNDAYTDISSILNIQLMKDTDTGEAWIEDVSYRPIFMADLYDYDINDYGWHYRMVDLHSALDSYESGEPWNFITNDVYADMAAGLDALYEFYGAPELDFAYDGGEEAA